MRNSALPALFDAQTGVYSVEMGYKEDLQKVQAKIDRLSDKLDEKPVGERIRTHSTKWWITAVTLALAFLALLVAIAAWLQPEWSTHQHTDLVSQINGQIDEKLKEPVGKINQISEDLADVKGTLRAWAPLITPQFYRKSSTLSQKDFEKSLPELKAVTQLAIESKTQIPSTDVTNLGKRLVHTAAGNTDSANLAWMTATTLLNYRSFLNALAPQPNLEDAKPLQSGKYDNRFFEYTRLGGEVPKLSSVGALPREQAAKLDLIGKDRNTDLQVGPALLVDVGGSIQLDKMHLKNVVLQNVHVIYEGGPLILENVYFINCTFEMKKSVPSQALSVSLMEPSPTRFSNQS